MDESHNHVGAVSDSVPTRLEIRRYWITGKLCTLPNIQDGKGLRNIGMVKRECHQGHIKDGREALFYPFSSCAGKKPFPHTVHGHWGVLRIRYSGDSHVNLNPKRHRYIVDQKYAYTN